GLHLLATSGAADDGPTAMRVAMVLGRGAAALVGDDAPRAARLFARAGEHVLAVAAYEAAAGLFETGAALLGDGALGAHQALAVRLEIGRARALSLLARNAEAEAIYAALCARDLAPTELGAIYQSRCDNQLYMMEKDRAVDIG